MNRREGQAVRLLKAVLMVVMLGVVVSPTADRASGQGVEVGAARNAIGTLLVVHPDGIQDRLRGKGLIKLFEEDVLKTEPGSQALIDFTDGVVLALNQNTTIKLLSRVGKDEGHHAHRPAPRGRGVGEDR
jgi:hypothetical protein